MAREIRGVSPGGTLYARLISPAGLWWNGSNLEAYAAGDYATYVLAMAAQGSSEVYVADFPSAIAVAGTYEYFIHRQAGVAPAEDDRIVNTGKIDWTGQAVAAAVAGAMSGSDFRDYLLRKGFKRTDKDTEIFEAITDAIQILRRRFMFDEAEVDATTTDQISVSGDFKLDIESDMGFLLGVILQDNDVGTPMVHVSKSKFDTLYPYINVDPDFQGYPRHFCVFAGQIQIGPIPDRLTYSYRITYSRRAGIVTAATVGVPFTNLYRDVLASKVLALLYEGLEDFDKAQYYDAKFEGGYAESVRRERKNAAATTFNMVPTNF